MDVILNYTNGLYSYQDKMTDEESFLTYSALRDVDWIFTLWEQKDFMIHALLLPPKETRSFLCQVFQHML